MNLKVGDWVRPRIGDPLDCVFGTVERVGARQCRVNFVRLPWTRSGASLPEMRDFPHDQLIRIRDPWADAAASRWSTPEESWLRVRAAQLWLGNVHGQLGNARTDLLPHQICLVHEVVDRPSRRLMIAEEVGMGKTIETGMIIHALIQRRELDRCLVICPAGQILQWQEELESKLKVRFEVYRQDVDGQRAFTFPRVIASLDTVKLDDASVRLKGKSHREILLDAPDWDLVVFDEAHRLTAKTYGKKTEKTLNYRLAEELCERTRDFLFLTGTPHDGNDSKFRNLLKALDPEVVFSAGETGRFFGNLVLKNRKSEAIDAEGRKLFRTVKVEKVSRPPDKDGEAQFHSALNRYLREGYGVAERDPLDPRSRAIGFVMTTFQKLATSSVAAVRKSLAKRLALLERRNVPESEDQADRDADERYEGEDEEWWVFDLQAKELREAFGQMELDSLRKLVGFPVPSEAKFVELSRLVKGVTEQDPDEKLLIFTEYRGTVAFLMEQLGILYGRDSVVSIMGGMGATARTDVIERFRSDANCRFLISTEAGGEGINLQFCNLIVNYDLPWNPFRVIQRIGRVHRIGQRRHMRVFNFQLQNELDTRLSDCHSGRVESAIRRLSDVTGLDVEDIRDQLLGFAQEFINYDQVYRDAIKQSDTKQSEVEIARGIKQAEEAFRLAYKSVFRHAVSPFNPDRFRSMVGRPLELDDLREWLGAYLKCNGRRLMWREETTVWEFLLPEDIKHLLPSGQKAVTGTFDRDFAMSEQSIELLAFGHPTIDLILRNALGPDSPGGAFNAHSAETSHSQLGVWIALRDNIDSNAAAFRLLTVLRNSDGVWRLAEKEQLPGGSEFKSPNTLDLSELKAEVVDFISREYPDLDFIEDRIFWLACALGRQPDN